VILIDLVLHTASNVLLLNEETFARRVLGAEIAWVVHFMIDSGEPGEEEEEDDDDDGWWWW
jgi:hypothetical protein